MARVKGGTRIRGATLIWLGAACAACTAGPTGAPPPPVTNVEKVVVGETVVLGMFEGSFDGERFEVHHVGERPSGAGEHIGEARGALTALPVLPALGICSTCTPTGSNYVAVQQIGGAMLIGGALPWDVANCGPAPNSGSCARIDLRNMYQQYEVLHPYVRFNHITPNSPPGATVTFNSNAATDPEYGVSATVALMRYEDRLAQAGVAPFDTDTLYWVFSSTSPPVLGFTFQGVVLGRLVDPIIRSSLVDGTSDLPPTYGGGNTTGTSPNGQLAQMFPFLVPTHIDMSSDGRYTVFQSRNDLAGTGTTTPQVYMRDNVAGTTRLVSRTSTGGLPPAGCSSSTPSITASGGFVVFLSNCQLDPSDTDTSWDVYRYDVAAGTSKLVSVDRNGNNSAASVSGSVAAISDDGNLVAFSVSQPMLDQFGQTCAGQQLWLYNNSNSRATRISVLDPAGPTPGACPTDPVGPLTQNQPAIDSAGGLVAYSSTATNLVPGDTNGCADIFVYNTTTQLTVRASLSETGAQLTGTVCASNNPAISSDGTHVAWDTQAANILSATGATKHVYAATIGAPSTVVRGDQTSAGTAGTGHAMVPSLSSEGRFIAFLSASALDPLDTNGSNDVYMRDTRTVDAAFSGAVWCSLSRTNGASARFPFPTLALSRDSNYVAFYADTLVPSTPNLVQAYRAPAR